MKRSVQQPGVSDLAVLQELMTLSHSWQRLASMLLTGLIAHPSVFRNFSANSNTEASVTVFMSHDKLVETVWSMFCAQQCGKLVFACTECFLGCLLSSTRPPSTHCWPPATCVPLTPSERPCVQTANERHKKTVVMPCDPSCKLKPHPFLLHELVMNQNNQTIAMKRVMM